jgi:hypothetical protein
VLISVIRGLAKKSNANNHEIHFNLLTQALMLYGTIPILRQQTDWVGGVRKIANFADVQYYLC